MKITIIYFLYTDGDYKLNYPQRFKCWKKNIELDNQFFDYAGCVEFADDVDLECKYKAKEFLWKFLCDGIHVSYTHPWIIKDFYKIIEDLEKNIDECTSNGIFIKHLFGNYENTKIQVIITK